MEENIEEIFAGITVTDIEKGVPSDKLNTICKEYVDRVTINGKNNSGMILPFFYVAYQNILDKRIYKALALFDDESIVREVLDHELMDIAKAQKKVSEFKILRQDVLTKRKNDSKNNENNGRELSIEVIENILKKHDIFVGNNLITKRTEIAGKGAEKIIYFEHSKANAEDVLIDFIQQQCKAQKLIYCQGNSGLSYISHYLNIIADKNRFNPVLNMFEFNKNNNVENLNKVLDVLNLKTDLEKTLFKKWLIQAVAVASNDDSNKKPLVAGEGVLTLHGPQGIGKTSFCRKLGVESEWFVEGAELDISSKDCKINVLSGFITEIGELDATMKRKQPAMKAFITNTLDRIRYPFGRRVVLIPRTTSFVATVNPEKFLKDETGNRRYWVLDVSNMDKEKLFALTKNDMQYMWGYAAYLYEQDKSSYRLTSQELAEINKRNRDYEENLSYEQEITELFDFNIDVSDWVWYSPSKIARVFSKGYINAEKVGRVIHKLSKEYPAIQKKRESNGIKYLLPPIDSFLLSESHF